MDPDNQTHRAKDFTRVDIHSVDRPALEPGRKVGQRIKTEPGRERRPETGSRRCGDDCPLTKHRIPRTSPSSDGAKCQSKRLSESMAAA
jgi:hypothetical protein